MVLRLSGQLPPPTGQTSRPTDLACTGATVEGLQLTLSGDQPTGSLPLFAVDAGGRSLPVTDVTGAPLVVVGPLSGDPGSRRWPGRYRADVPPAPGRLRDRTQPDTGRPTDSATSLPDSPAPASAAGRAQHHADAQQRSDDGFDIDGQTRVGQAIRKPRFGEHCAKHRLQSSAVARCPDLHRQPADV